MSIAALYLSAATKTKAIDQDKHIMQRTWSTIENELTDRFSMIDGELTANFMDQRF